MPRKKKEINPKQGERLQSILKEQKISQKYLSKKIHLSEKTISAMINGRSSLTHATAVSLLDLFPEAGYRYEWIMGYDDFKTNRDMFVSVINDSQIESDLLYSGTLAFLRLSGYNVSPAYESDGTIEGTVKAMTSGYVISRDGQSITMDILQFNRFSNKIKDFVNFELEHKI